MSTRWRWPPESSPKVRVGGGSGRPWPAPRAPPALGAPRAPPPGRRESAHQRDVQGADRDSPGASARSAAPPRRARPQRPRQRRAARRAGPGRASSCRRRWAQQPTRSPALHANETSLSTGGRRSRRPARRPGPGASARHPCLPPVKPRTIASALAAPSSGRWRRRALGPERVAVERVAAEAPVWRAIASASLALSELSGKTAFTARAGSVASGRRRRRPRAGPAVVCEGITAPTTSMP